MTKNDFENITSSGNAGTASQGTQLTTSQEHELSRLFNDALRTVGGEGDLKVSYTAAIHCPQVTVLYSRDVVVPRQHWSMPSSLVFKNMTKNPGITGLDQIRYHREQGNDVRRGIRTLEGYVARGDIEAVVGAPLEKLLDDINHTYVIPEQPGLNTCNSCYTVLTIYPTIVRK